MKIVASFPDPRKIKRLLDTPKSAPYFSATIKNVRPKGGYIGTPP